jgi:chromosomal replication initiation ATPase DnaA
MNAISPIQTETPAQMFFRHTAECEAMMRGVPLSKKAYARIQADRIIKSFGERHGFTIEQMQQPNRGPRALSHIRQDCMAFLRKNTDMSLTDIGEALGDRDHATILHGDAASKARSTSGQKDLGTP